ncbi:hypothetical protein IQ266_27330 [filamentous cyanobacterium LEGE 11480]|uniref:Uncharacterized protein n=1 Tax=Romeriopsis navalis LEGE 11480 TaxID=2777977 RepID=A0A928VRJ9_9CYAN|nr:hypothetical protein [Romeriopsis navalis]MBE9033448.1 hypothetical protein [Romeriopsis navalis LEGE 11480]
MVRAKTRRPNVSAFDRLEQIFITGRIQRSDYLCFSNMLLSGEQLNEHERERLSRLFDHLRIGRIKLID